MSFFSYVKHYDNNFTENNAQTNWIFTVSIFSRILNVLFVFHFFSYIWWKEVLLFITLFDEKKSVLHELLNVFDQNGNKTSENRKRNYCWTVSTRHKHMCISSVVNICSIFFFDAECDFCAIFLPPFLLDFQSLYYWRALKYLHNFFGWFLSLVKWYKLIEHF